MTIELANAGVEATGSCFYRPPPTNPAASQGLDRVSAGSVWFPQLSDAPVLPEGLVALEWAHPGVGLTPVLVSSGSRVTYSVS